MMKKWDIVIFRPSAFLCPSLGRTYSDQVQKRITFCSQSSDHLSATPFAWKLIPAIYENPTFWKPVFTCLQEAVIVLIPIVSFLGGFSVLCFQELCELFCSYHISMTTASINMLLRVKATFHYPLAVTKCNEDLRCKKDITTQFVLTIDLYTYTEEKPLTNVLCA